jgi:hypothetical protein
MIFAFLFGIPFAWWIAILAILFIIDVACFAAEEYGWSVCIMSASLIGAMWIDHHAPHPWLSSNLHQLFLIYIPAYLGLGLATAFVKWILFAAKRVGWITDAKQKFDAKKFDPKKPDFKFKATDDASEELRKRLNRGAYDPHGPLGKLSDEDQAKYNARVVELAAQYEAEWTATLPAQKRQAFVEFYKGNLPYDRKHKVYEVNYGKETAVVDALTPRAKDNVGKITIWIYQWPVVIVSSLIEDLLIKLAKHFARFLDMVFSRVVRAMVAKATKGL